MIAHLFSKVYLSFDTTLRPLYDNLIVSTNNMAVCRSFINEHVSLGKEHGVYSDLNEVDWSSFFNSVNPRRTVIYADAINFGKIYFSFLKTANPSITFSNAKKIFEIVLKRTIFYIEYDTFGIHQGEEAREVIKQEIDKIRENYELCWNESVQWNLSEEFVNNEIGIEFLAAKYWAYGTGLDSLKEKLESIWWKNFVGWGEEAYKIHSQRWIYENSVSNPLIFKSEMSVDPDLYWMADPDLDLEKSDIFRQKHGWQIIEKIWNYLKNIQDTGQIIVELEPHWQSIVEKDWDKILSKENPITLMAPASEPVYRLLINSWLMSYFASKSTEELKDFVL